MPPEDFKKMLETFFFSPMNFQYKKSLILKNPPEGRVYKSKVVSENHKVSVEYIRKLYPLL